MRTGYVGGAKGEENGLDTPAQIFSHYQKSVRANQIAVFA